MSSLPTGHFIAGQQSHAGTQTFQAEQAGSGEPLAPAFAEATTAEVEMACQAAAAVADEFADLPLARRAGLLEAIADALDARADAFVARTGLETGLPEPRLRGELARTSGQLRLFASVVRRGDFLGVRIDHGDPDREPAPKPDIRQYQIPLGPVAVFGASNFPLAFSVCGGDTASALAAGCPVVVKGHPAHPGTSAIAAEAVTEALQQLKLPAGIFSLLQGERHELGTALVQHPAIQAVGFTGSQRGGLALQSLAAQRPTPIPVYAEMGSVNPLFILPDALAERAEAIATGLAASFTLGCGQFCTNPGLVFLPSGERAEAFKEALCSHVEAMPAAAMLHRGILSAFETGCERLADMPGVTRLAAGQTAPGLATAQVYATDLATFRGTPGIAEEVFGPVTVIVELDDVDRMHDVAQGLEGQLTAGLHGTDAELAASRALITLLGQRAGRVLCNGFPTGVEVGEAMVHGGPWPATTNSRTTSVGTRAIERFLRPVSLQDMPEAALPAALQSANPLGLPRLVDGAFEAGSAGT